MHGSCGVEIDVCSPHPARVYDYFLGGKDNYAADRAAGDAMIAQLPTIPVMARANRDFLARAVTRLTAEAGITRFLDLGCGIPAVNPVHEVAQALDPTAQVLYVDTDPLVLAHSRALLCGGRDARVEVMAGDIGDPQTLLQTPQVAALRGDAHPVGVLLVSVLMYFTDTQIEALLTALADALPTDSVIIVSHPTAEFDPAAVAAAVAVAEQAGITYRPRSRARLETLLAGLDLVPPGVVALLDWPTPGQVPLPEQVYYWAAAARVPGPPAHRRRINAIRSERVDGPPLLPSGTSPEPVDGLCPVPGVPGKSPGPMGANPDTRQAHMIDDAEPRRPRQRRRGHDREHPDRESDQVTTRLHDDAGAAEFRDALVDTLLGQKIITSAAVERAFRTVPRHLFVAENTALDVTYNVDNAVPIKRDPDGVIVSSTSAAYIQARMIEQAELADGMSVLEIGSGGFNAALLAEVVGPGGRVVSVDIDPEVTDRARELLDATGYGSRVTVVQADADKPLPDRSERFDAILVTVGAWDLAPAWLEQLSANGRIVVPLRMNGITRVVAFRRAGGHLESISAEVAGFVPMQGEGARDERVFLLPDRHGHHVKLRFEDAVPPDVSLLDGVLASERTEAWAGVTVAHGVSFADLHLWFAAFLPGFCKLAADEGSDLAAEHGSWFPFGVVRGDSFAYLAVRPLADRSGVEFGARAYGPHGVAAAAAMCAQIRAWDRDGRHREPSFTYWPNGTRPHAFGTDTAVLVKTNGLATISWSPQAHTGGHRRCPAQPGNEE
jgi:protein-L-isoaspartate(D-aspartate) O-methyltransferase